MNFRAEAPAVKKIKSLQFKHVYPQKLIGGIELYKGPSRPLGVLRLDIVWPKGGSIYQQHLYQARTALNLSLNGTGALSAEQIQEEFEHMGASFGFNTTPFAATMVLKASCQNFYPALKWFLDCYQNAVFPEHELDNYKQIEIAALQRKMHTARYWSNRIGLESLFHPGHPMSSFSGPGEIQALHRHDVVRFHTDVLNPNHATWIITGETDAIQAEVLGELLSLFSKPLHAPKEHANFDESIPDKKGLINHKVEHASQVSMYMGRRINFIDEIAYHQFSLLNMILGGFFGSRLMQEIREERGLTYGIGSYIAQSTHGNIWVISGEMNSDNAHAAVDASKEILHSMISSPPTGDELERAKKYYSGQLHASFDGPFSMSQKIQNLMQRGFIYNHYDKALDSIWKTTTEDLCKLADNYLNPDSFITILAGDIKT